MVDRRILLVGNAIQLAAVREMQQAGKLPEIPEGAELVLVESDRVLTQVGDEVLELPASFPEVDRPDVELRPYQKVYDQGASGNAWAYGAPHAAQMLSLFCDMGGYGHGGNGDWRFADAPKPPTPKPPLTAAIGPPKNRKERRRDQRIAAQLLKTVRKRTGREKPA